MNKFEYIIKIWDSEKGEFQKWLNPFGEDSWELCMLYDVHHGRGLTHGRRFTVVTCIFKRRIK